jgi:hypothetical protein
MPTRRCGIAIPTTPTCITAMATEAARTRGAAAARPRGRDLRLDFFRGLALIFIFIDHIPNNFLGWFTLHSFAFSDAAEVFIFISGYTAALVYGRALRQHGALFATAQVYRRVWQLYVAHIFLFVIFTAEVSYAEVALNNPMYSEELHVADFLVRPHIAIIQALLLRFQPTFLDILPLYIVLLGLFPLVLLALERGPLWALLPSAVLYVLTDRLGWTVPAFPDQSVWFFNPLAWQFLFVIGAGAGHARVSGRWPFPQGEWLSRLALAVALVFLLINLTWLLHRLYDPFPALWEKVLLDHLDKSILAPLRLANFFALALTTVRFVRPESRFLAWRAAYPIILCGQHSLYVFCVSIAAAVCSRFILIEFYSELPVQIMVNLAGLALMVGTAALLAWYKAASTSRAARASIPASPSE